MKKDQKTQVIEEIAAQIDAAEAIYAVDYRGLSVTQAAELRVQPARGRRELPDRQEHAHAARRRQGRRGVAQAAGRGGPDGAHLRAGRPGPCGKGARRLRPAGADPRVQGRHPRRASLDPDELRQTRAPARPRSAERAARRNRGLSDHRARARPRLAAVAVSRSRSGQVPGQQRAAEAPADAGAGSRGGAAGRAGGGGRRAPEESPADGSRRSSRRLQSSREPRERGTRIEPRRGGGIACKLTTESGSTS